MYNKLIIADIENYENMKLRDLSYPLSEADALLKKRISSGSILPGIEFKKIGVPGVVKDIIGGESELKWIEDRNKYDKGHIANILGISPNGIDKIYKRFDLESGKTTIKFSDGYCIEFDTNDSPIYSEVRDGNLPSIRKSIKLKSGVNAKASEKGSKCGVCCDANISSLKDADFMDFEYKIEITPSGIINVNYSKLFCEQNNGYLLPDFTSRDTEKNNKEFEKTINVKKIRELSQEDGFFYDIVLQSAPALGTSLDIGSLQNKKMQEFPLKRLVERIEDIQNQIEPRIDNVENYLKVERVA